MMADLETVADCNAALVVALEALRQLDAVHRRAEQQLADLYRRRAELTIKRENAERGDA